ncbi:MAG TPA: NAD(P)/FAD-dependent oxidoreductase, partial [Chloroflexia bacterium]
MDSTERTGNGATAPEEQPNLQPSGTQPDGAANDELYDLTIIGAGPTGLFAAFYAGMRTMRTKIIDALPEPGGQLMALYPEKYIYDAPGFPKIVAKDLVKNLVEQATQWNPALVLGERVLRLEQAAEGHWVLTTDKGVHLSRAILIAAGVGAFAPNKLNAPGLTDLEGQAVHYFVKEKAAFQGKDLLIVGGGDSAVDWALNLKGVAKSITVIHRRNEFRAHESTVAEMMESGANVLTPYEVKEVSGDGKIERVTIYNNKTNEEQTLD